MPHPSNPPPRVPQTTGDRLDSWKEIAQHLNRSVSTVQRWEREEDLPVHRHRHAKLGSVYASKRELDDWWASRGLALDAAQSPTGSHPAEHEVQEARSAAGDAGGQTVRAFNARGAWKLSIGTLVVAGAAALMLIPALRSRSATATSVGSVAVLPFKELGASKDTWFSEGVTDAVRIALSRRTSAKVSVASSSSVAVLGEKGPRETARALGVDALVEGTVLRSNGRVRINLTVVDGASGQRLAAVWSEQDLSRSYGLYEEVAGEVAARLNADTKPAGHPAVARAVNPDAYEAYLRGRYFRKRRQSGGCRVAEPHLAQALALEPGFAPAHAELAFCYGFDRLSDRLAPAEAARRGRDEAARALARDADLPQAHVALGLVQHRIDYDWQSAERSFRRALNIAPDDVDARVFLAELQSAGGRAEEAAVNYQSALALDPFHLDHNTGFGFALYTMQRYDAAVTQLRKTLELEPSWPLARFWLAESLAAQRRHDEAVAEYLNLLQHALVPTRRASAMKQLKDVYDRQGWLPFWKAELALAEEDVTHRGAVWLLSSRTGPYFMARRYARLGQNDRVLVALEAAYAERSYMLIFFAVDPILASVRSDPRFHAFAGRVGLHLPGNGG